ncbi:GTP pyrophosphokinase [Jiangella alba]|uniref:PpGpp synthetase catalytic domain-containing protein (RelA/SpoT-type nucleotidyltranferase) n=1 Tax=Jiangella alba TaxID=561176 RepID=A0A1H5I725_9ACTN|nr:hypothetical protein [Jiangella alba]SEE35268.1 ppGpp synthetase catalytic domain-containing protein (RelA/SpoT-type nucleotidyltranferase) [Jiangella alba]
MAEPTADDWGARYAARRHTYEECASRLRDLLKDVLRSADIEVVQIESRAKTVASFVEKITRKRRDDPDPIAAMTDLVGLRVITYYAEDLRRVGALIDREFEIDHENSADKIDGLALDQFGYRSTHYVVRLGPSRRDLLEWAPFQAIRAEIQVRTALQHAWAAVSHKVEYKSAALPEPVRRRLYRLSALFELADEQFSSLRDQSDATDTEYRAEVSRGSLDVPVDTSSIGAYLSITGRGDELKAFFHANGFDAAAAVSEERLSRDRSDLVDVLNRFGLTTLADLDAFIADTARMRSALRLVLEVHRRLDAAPAASLDDALTLLLIAALDDSDRPGSPPYAEDWAEALSQIRQEA